MIITYSPFESSLLIGFVCACEHILYPFLLCYIFVLSFFLSSFLSSFFFLSFIFRLDITTLADWA